MSSIDLDAELKAERDHLEVSRAALHAMRVRAEQLYSCGAAVAGDPFAAETLGIALARRVAQLADNQHTPLFFGRLDLHNAPITRPEAEPGAAETDPAETLTGRFHIGRRHVTDALGEPLVLDWRAPVSRAFYRASVADPKACGRGADSALPEEI